MAGTVVNVLGATGRRQLEVQRALAAGARPRELAERYGVTVSAVHEFNRRHASVINEIRARLNDQFAGLWIAQKANRLAELQRIVEHADDQRTAMAALKQAAEELGELSARMHVTADVREHVTYRIEVGTDAPALS